MLDELQGLRVECANAIRALPSRQKTGPEVEAACGLVEFYARSGLLDQEAGADVVAKANDSCSLGWNGVLAALLEAPAWQISSAPRIEDLPLWIWPVYSECLLRLPPSLSSPGQADHLAAHYTRRLREIVKLVEANAGSAAVKSVIERFQAAGDCTLLCNSVGSLKELLALRGRLLAAVSGVTRGDEIFLMPREGRRMKIGFVIESLESVPEARAALPWIEYLDERRFETILFTLKPAFTDLATHLFGKVSDSRLIGEDRGEALQQLRNGLVDVAVFFTRSMRAGDAVTALAVHRSAPLQIVFDESGLTSGLPNADLAVLEAGVSLEKERVERTERLVGMPDTGVAFVANSVRAAAGMEWNREGLGVPVDAVVYASVAPFRYLTPEWLNAAGRILNAVPESRLLLYSYDPEDQADAALGRLCRLIETEIVASGVEQARIIVSNEKLPSEAEVLSLMKIADIYLDTCPVSLREPVQLAVEAGLPILTCADIIGRDRFAVVALRRLGLERCIAPNLGSLVELASKVGSDAANRQSLQDSLKEALGRPQTVYDPIAFADAFALVLETAFDAVLARGRPGYEPGMAPLQIVTGEDLGGLIAEAAILLESGLAPEAASRISRAIGMQPTNPEARELLQKVLMAEYRFERAADSLLADVERQGTRGDLWYRLGLALRGAGKRQDALKAFEVALRLVPDNLECWLVLGELAVEAGNASMLKDIADIASKLAPEDLRVKELQSRI